MAGNYSPGEYSITFYLKTGVSGEWDGTNDRFTYDPDSINILNMGKDPDAKYSETLALYYITFHSRPKSAKMAFWTDKRHPKDATWTDRKQLGAAKTEWICKKVAGPVRDNLCKIKNHNGPEVCSVTKDDSDSEIFRKVVRGKGSPDIFEFQADSTDPDITFIEVKGPDDSELNPDQKTWFDAMEGIFPGYKAQMTKASKS